MIMTVLIFPHTVLILGQKGFLGIFCNFLSVWVLIFCIIRVFVLIFEVESALVLILTLFACLVFVQDTKDVKVSEIPKNITTCAKSKANDKIGFNIIVKQN